MAIDYISGSGVFDKLGALIRVINSFETFETGTLQTKLTNIFNKLETANDYDDQARKLFYQIDSEEKNALRAWKQDMASIVQPILTQEMDEAETFFSQDINALLDYLVFCMNRDAASIDGSTISFTGPAAGTPSPTGNFSVVASKYFPTVQGADASSQENGIIWDNTYRVSCVNRNVSGAEQFQVQGDLPQGGGRTNPLWYRAGDCGILQLISSISNTLLNNGGFENLNAAGTSFANWVLNTGSYTTDIVQHATPYRGTYALKFVNSAKITQTLATGILQPYTKYLVSLKAKKASSGDGTMNVGFTGTTGFFWTLSAASLTTSYAHYSAFFNTGANPASITDFICERTGSSTGNVFIDEVCLTPIPLIHGLGLAVIGGSTDPLLNDFWNVRPGNNGEGTIMKFFGRWFDRLLPGKTDASETIADSLAE